MKKPFSTSHKKCQHSFESRSSIHLLDLLHLQANFTFGTDDETLEPTAEGGRRICRSVQVS